MTKILTLREVRLDNKQFIKWIKKIHATQDGEIDCDETQTFLPAFVDAIVEQQPLDHAVIKKVEAHLNQCPDCNELYEGLKHVAAADLSDTKSDNVATLQSSKVAE